MRSTDRKNQTVENIKHEHESFRFQDQIIFISITLRREGFLRTAFLYQKPQSNICITEIKLYRRNLCLGSTELFCWGLLSLKWISESVGLFPTL